MAARQKAEILIVDDEPAVRELLARQLASEGYVAVQAAGGEEALACLARQPFELLMTDMRMPGMDGLALLREAGRRYPELGVIMLTGCEDIAVAVAALKSGALDYIQKPFDLKAVSAGVRGALERVQSLREMTEHLRRLEQVVERQSIELRRLLGDLREASESTLEALVTALDAREHETQAHSQRVGEYTLRLAHEMGVPKELLESYRRGAMLHDVGKIGVPDRILLKPGRLTEEEWQEMRRHPLIGYWILNVVPALRDASEIALCHHERFDGLGYPRGLRAEEIPLGARIFAVVDCLDAMTSDRPYHRGQSYGDARREILEQAGRQFDPVVAEHFLRIPEEDWAEIRRRTLAASEPAKPAGLVMR